MPEKPRLQILISTKGNGIERIANLPHPQFPGVEYLVSWQLGNMDLIPEPLAERKDFRILIEDSVGLSKNRNNALKHSTADWVLISDDDLCYTERNIRNILEGFENNKDCSVLAFRYESSDYPRVYPAQEFNLRTPPKGYFSVSFEIGFNLSRLKEEMRLDVLPAFNENFGLGAIFNSGEEDLLIHNMMRHNLSGRFIPLDICRHEGPTTGIKEKTFESFIQTKGAVMSHIKPFSWPLRMAVYALRASNDKDGTVPFMKYIAAFLAGVRKARKLKVFDVPSFIELN